MLRTGKQEKQSTGRFRELSQQPLDTTVLVAPNFLDTAIVLCTASASAKSFVGVCVSYWTNYKLPSPAGPPFTLLVKWH